MARKLVFVTGHGRPVAADDGATFVRRHEDGSPMVADGFEDTLEACAARWAKGGRRSSPARTKSKRGTRAKASDADNGGST